MKKIPYFHLVMLFAIILSGCAGPSPAVTPSAAVPPAAAPSATLPATQTPAPPTQTFTPSPTPPPTATATATLTPTLGVGSQRISPIDGMVMVYVPAGEFWMGSDRKNDKHHRPQETYQQVVLDAFWIDQTEVTNAMFARFVAETSYQTTEEMGSGGNYLNLEKKVMVSEPKATWRNPYGPDSSSDALGAYPVVQVSKADAEAYCAWAGRTLPSEAQWEKAARGTDGRVYPWGDELDSGNRANFADKNLYFVPPIYGLDPGDRTIDDGYQFAAPVGSYLDGASPYGALDMAGNVIEWTSTCFLPPKNNRVQPAPGEQFCRLKGGSFRSSAAAIRPADNEQFNPAPPGYGRFDLGFRCAEIP